MRGGGKTGLEENGMDFAADDKDKQVGYGDANRPSVARMVSARTHEQIGDGRKSDSEIAAEEDWSQERQEDKTHETTLL